MLFVLSEWCVLTCSVCERVNRGAFQMEVWRTLHRKCKQGLDDPTLFIYTQKALKDHFYSFWYFFPYSSNRGPPEFSGLLFGVFPAIEEELPQHKRNFAWGDVLWLVLTSVIVVLHRYFILIMKLHFVLLVFSLISVTNLKRTQKQHFWLTSCLNKYMLQCFPVLVFTTKLSKFSL